MRPTAILTALVAATSLHAQGAWDQGYNVPDTPAVLSMRAQAETVNRLLRERLDNLLPSLMRDTGIDMWIVINREYAEDPVYLTLVPEPVFAARRRLGRRPADARGRDARVEHTALLVWSRLLRATIDAIEAEGQAAKKRKPRRPRQAPHGPHDPCHEPDPRP